MAGNAVIGQSGGPTSVINQSLVGVIEAVRDKRHIGKLLAFQPVFDIDLGNAFHLERADLVREVLDLRAGILGIYLVLDFLRGQIHDLRMRSRFRQARRQRG